MNLDLVGILAALDIRESREVFEPHWEESVASLPADAPGFLQAAEFTVARAFAGLPAELDPVLRETARRICEHPALLRLAWHCDKLLFDCPDCQSEQARQWPDLETSLGDLCGVFYLLLALDAVPRVRALHREMGVPEAITRDTCSHFGESIPMYRETHGGRWGFPPQVLYWLRNHTAGRLFGPGRLEYMVRPFGGRIQVFRNRETDEVLALAQEGTRFNSEGYIDAEPDPSEGSDGWTSRLVVTEEAATGFPISPLGVGVPREVELPLSRWRRVLAPGDPVLETHIPGGGGMTPERCQDSMRQALEFFTRYLPDRPFVGFACGSWILNPQLAQIYTPTSNMVLWQRELYLYPIPSGSRSGLYFVFGEDDVDPDTAPRNTSMRRALLDHLGRGGRLRAGGMFLLKEDFAHFGSQHYRSHCPSSGMDGAAGPEKES